ncbi:MAG: bifunctional riboflavin kinase/FAD synthetase [Clostridiaceae bacterium]|nr:bifunctional riboflavin kinase/FAD synthetase [Eubacteriales bacterium]
MGNSMAPERSVVALGMFDGVHAGHRKLMSEAAALARENSLALVAYTFQNHPLSVFGGAPKLLSGLDARTEMLASFGARVAVDEFTLELAATEPEAFVHMLSERFSMAYAVAGFNYTFGRNGAGDAALLKELGKKHGFFTREVAPYLYGGEPVSSTRIRASIEAGDLKNANAMLERDYALSGTVVRNRRIGSSIGFPTANLGGVEDMVLPKPGVYATRALVDAKLYKSVTSVGKNPTVGGAGIHVETHIMGFDRDIYGERLTVFFVGFLRDELLFDSVEELALQITKDVERAKAVG